MQTIRALSREQESVINYISLTWCRPYSFKEIV